ncbi:MAG: error-prone DNA polymerase [Deltaproteobacteria bacterium]|nr:error-prone DNA polymerase [Deltaproteobacteria bacterium]
MGNVRALRAPPRTRYVELRARSAFSFLQGASLPEELAQRAADLGYEAMALGDAGGVYGCPRFHLAAKELGLRPLVAGDLQLTDGLGSVRLLVESERGYRNLCRLFTLSHQGRPKGEHAATLPQLCAHAEGLVALLGACTDVQSADRVAAALGRERAVAEVSRHLDPVQERGNRKMAALAEKRGLGLVATGDVRFARPTDRPLYDVLTCIRHSLTLDNAGTALARSAEQHLHEPSEMALRFADLPRAVDATAELAARCAFTLEKLPYRFPDFPVPDGGSQQAYLETLTWAGAKKRYGSRLERDPRVATQLRHELALIGKLSLAGYFLIVWDLVRFCGERRILVQGRGSAANSAVCFALGITAVEPLQAGLLFERFLSEERGEWPDIDLDLPSGDRREEVIQYVYKTYGPRGAAMCAEVITYKSRLALREVGKVLGLDAATIDQAARSVPPFEYREDEQQGVDERLVAAGLPPEGHRLRLYVKLADSMIGLPRHLSQHSGGMVIAQGALDELVPLEPAAMPDRTTLQWDKDDCEGLHLIKIDLLGLGMMAALEQCRDVLEARGQTCDYAQLPHDDPKIYAVARKGDTVGVFQIESRAQMATLPRLQPTRFYDLVVSVGLIRPGPIVGKMVHPYLARRAGREVVRYPHPDLEPVLQRTLGVPLFQEQLMRIAMVAGGLTGGEAQELRKAMTHKRSRERIARFDQKMRSGMHGRGYNDATIDEVLTGIRAFAEYGFPESHSASFALLVYASLWLKVYHPAVFLAALLDNQPMGFYSPATLIKDAQRHGVHVYPACVVNSQVKSTVLGEREMRLGLEMVGGLGTAVAQRILKARSERPFTSVSDVCVRAQLDTARAEALAEAGAFAALGATRRQALWRVDAAVGAGGLAPPPAEGASPLKELTPVQRTLADYASTGVTVGPHLVGRMRDELQKLGVTPADRVLDQPNGSWQRIAGLVIIRQRPGTAKGMVFLSLEDETGLSNAVIDPPTFQEHRQVLLGAQLLMVEGPLQNIDGVATVKGKRFHALAAPKELPASRDFH